MFRSRSSAEPLPLMDLCRRAARLALGRDRLQEIESLPLPQSLKNYLQYQWLTPPESPTQPEPLHPTRLTEGMQRTSAASAKALQKLDFWKDGERKGSLGQHQVHLDLQLLFFPTPLLTGDEWLMMVSTVRNQSFDSTVALLPLGGGNKNCTQKAHESWRPFWAS